jgi:hypothetical protein
MFQSGVAVATSDYYITFEATAQTLIGVLTRSSTFRKYESLPECLVALSLVTAYYRP